MEIGKCPKSDEVLEQDEIIEKRIRVRYNSHFAYVCKRCGYIMGFSSCRTEPY